MNLMETWGLKPGNHIYVQHWFYSHHGIVVSSRKVIHFADGVVCETSLQEFADEGKIEKYNYSDPTCSHPAATFESAQIVARAKSMLGHRGYSLRHYNCEHFCNWCVSVVTGESISEQWGKIFTFPLGVTRFGFARKLHRIVSTGDRQFDAPGDPRYYLDEHGNTRVR